MKNKQDKQDRHGSARDRGRADYYYGRPYDPHYNEGDSITSKLIQQENMTEEEIKQYAEGFRDQLDGQKDWGVEPSLEEEIESQQYTEGYATIMEDGYGGKNEPW